MMKSLLGVSIAAALGFGLGAGTAAADDLRGGEMTIDGIASTVRRMAPAGRDAEGWGEDVWDGLVRNVIPPRPENVCAVLAVIAQESSFDADPAVPGLGLMAERRMVEMVEDSTGLKHAMAQGLGWFVRNRPTPETSYAARLRKAKTEHDVDRVFRKIVFDFFQTYLTTAMPNSQLVARRVDAANPVRTIGSMQVAVAYAVAVRENESGKALSLQEIWMLRDELYTRPGGIAFGTRLLLGYYAGYKSRIYVFADYNAGRYASRNAAFQTMVAKLSHVQLALDGDLLIYEQGEVAETVSSTEKAVRALDLGLSDDELRTDLLLEKTYGLRDTRTYRLVAKRYAHATGKPAPYAVLPQITLHSPKLKHGMTTERFARSVMRRYEDCLTP